MKRPRLQRVRGDYRPRYPRTLTADDYRELVAPDQRARLLAATAAAGVAMAALPAQDPGKARDREAAVLARLPREGGFWFQHTTFARVRNDFGSDVVVPRIPISFGNSHNGVFDSERARSLARELFAAYGLDAAADADPGVDGVRAKLDGLDAAAKIGFELRGRTRPEQQPFDGAAPEPEAQALDADEHRRLQAAGYTVFTGDVGDYPLMDGDQFTPLLAWLGGVVGFLNSVTDGPDIDLGAVLGPRRLRMPLPIAGVRGAAPDEDGVVRQPRTRTLVPLRVDAAAGAEIGTRGGRYEVLWEKASAPVTAAGAPTFLRLVGFDTLHGQPPPRVRLDQHGEPPLHVAVEGLQVLLPSRFDAGRPFTLTLQLEPGSYVLPSSVEIWMM